MIDKRKVKVNVPRRGHFGDVLWATKDRIVHDIMCVDSIWIGRVNIHNAEYVAIPDQRKPNPLSSWRVCVDSDGDPFTWDERSKCLASLTLTKPLT